LKVLLFDAAILMVLTALSVLFIGRSKQRLAEQLAETFRAPLIAGDNRQIILDMPRPVLKDFRGVIWRPAGNGYSFSLPANFAPSSAWEYASLDVKVFFDEMQTIEAGNLHFIFSRWEALPTAFISWLLLVSLSILIGYFEWKRLLREYALSLESQINESKANLAAQVAHDIRSPLAALGSAAKDLALPEEQRSLIEGAVGRMQGIADDLLQRYRAPSAAPVNTKPAVYALSGLIEQVLVEKRLQYKEKTGVKIEFTGASGEIKALVEPKELQRLISNLVSNSVEAFDGPGMVSVGLSAPDGRVLIEVKDNGKGIPPEILAKLGRKGETHGKAGGSGLGLYHARTTIEGWGGSFIMKSEPGQGTAVLITLPRAAARPAGRTAVLLDDDLLVHMNWKLAAKAAGVDLKAYKIPEDFAAGIEALPKDTPIYIDSDLGNGLKGENIAKELYAKGFADLTMATGHVPEEFARLPWLKVAGKEPPWA